MTYIIVAFGTVLLNNVLLSVAPYRLRVAFGYTISFTTLIFVAICEVGWHLFEAPTAYSVNLAAVSLVAIGCTVQQSSYYGFASMLPKKYTLAVMAGESIINLFFSIIHLLKFFFFFHIQVLLDAWYPAIALLPSSLLKMIEFQQFSFSYCLVSMLRLAMFYIQLHHIHLL